MGISRDIGQFLQNNGIGTLVPLNTVDPNANIYDEKQPDEPDAMVSVHRGPGLAPEFVHDSLTAAIRNTGLQIRVRGNPDDQTDVEAKALEVQDVMERLVEQVFSGTRYLRALPVGDIGTLEEDSRRRREYMLNFVVKNTEA